MTFLTNVVEIDTDAPCYLTAQQAADHSFITVTNPARKITVNTELTLFIINPIEDADDGNTQTETSQTRSDARSPEPA
jgi:hypothetical protein